MPTTMTFAKVKAYLDAIADKNLADGNGDIANSPHGRFWNKPYQDFIKDVVPGGAQVQCNGNDTPIILKSDPAKTPFYLLLTDPAGWCGFERMPAGGPFITDAGYQVMVDGTMVSGDKIKQDLLEWLTNGFPE